MNNEERLDDRYQSIKNEKNESEDIPSFIKSLLGSSGVEVRNVNKDGSMTEIKSEMKENKKVKYNNPEDYIREKLQEAGISFEEFAKEKEKL